MKTYIAYRAQNSMWSLLGFASFASVHLSEITDRKEARHSSSPERSSPVHSLHVLESRVLSRQIPEYLTTRLAALAALAHLLSLLPVSYTTK